MIPFNKFQKIGFALIAIYLLINVFQGQIISSLNHLWYGHLNKATSIVNKTVDLPPGTIVTLTVDSKLLGTSRTAYLYLPPNYEVEKSTHKYPTLYLLHGFPGAPKDYLINAGLTELVDELIEKQVMPPTIIVLVDGNGPKHSDSQYLNATLINQPMEDNIITEVVPAVDLSYATLATASSRAIGGVSTGGYGAVNLLLHNPSVFNYAISHSGYFEANDPASTKLIGNDQASFLYESPLLYLSSLATVPPVQIYFDLGELDHKYLPVNEQFDALLTSKGITHVFQVTPGWHTWGVWRSNLQSSLTWLGSKLR